MTNEELNTALYKKVFAGQEQYRDWQAASASCTAILARMTRCWARKRSIAGWSKSCKAKYIAKHGMPKMRFHDLRHPYVKHTTKNKSLQKQKSQTTNDNLIVWDFCFFDLCRAVVLKILSAGWHFY